jgi:FkbM family methyltransferase
MSVAENKPQIEVATTSKEPIIQDTNTADTKSTKQTEMSAKFEEIKPGLVMTNSKIGNFAVYKNDTIVSHAIRLFGEYAHAEIDVMSLYLNEDSVYLDVGTNIGYHALAIHKQNKCKVLAFEPHPTHFLVAAFNCQNSPIQVLNEGLSDEDATIKIDDFDIDVAGNYGEVASSTEGIEVQVTTLDSLKLTKCDLIKIDVEGLEYKVLMGGLKTIEKFRPVIFYEAIDDVVWPTCHKLLDSMGYKQYWVGCKNKPIRPTFHKTDDNPFGKGAVANILAVPNERDQPDFLIPSVEFNSKLENFNEILHRYKRYILIF